MLSADALAPPAAAVAALQQLDEASIWRLLLQARAGRTPVRSQIHAYLLCPTVDCEHVVWTYPVELLVVPNPDHY